jgi:hypothetical protein
MTNEFFFNRKIVKIHHEKNHQLQQRVERWIYIYIYIIILTDPIHGSKSFD